MEQIKSGIIKSKAEDRYQKAKFVPAGQSTQMIIGATKESDRSILHRSEFLYKKYDLKRVYYSAYVPVNKGPKLPAIETRPPLLREHRLYQADFLLRFYKFSATEILSERDQELDLDFDPKMIWALRHLDQFPMEVNKVSYHQLLRIPGIGMISARRIIRQRQVQAVTYDHLKKMGVVLKRAKFFLTCQGRYYGQGPLEEAQIRRQLAPPVKYQQMQLF